MGFNCGIVGLPNVGKSTLFNAISETSKAEAANYPFCTIEPNVGVVAVPDARLDRLSQLYHPVKTTPTSLEFVDIAGLVKGASRGEGLGNQFLSHIRQVQAVVHVVRCFEDGNVVHVAGSVDPERDVEIVDTELCLKDLESVEKRREREQKAAKGTGKPAAQVRVALGLVMWNPAPCRPSLYSRVAPVSSSALAGSTTTRTEPNSRTTSSSATSASKNIS